MRVLVACEFSGRVRDAFMRRGHDALSCDLLPSESQLGPHFEGDVREILHHGWDLMIGHPPCKYLSRAGARWMHRGGLVNECRLHVARQAKEFFLELLHAPIPMICLENPLPLSVVGLPSASQSIQPYEHGERSQKRPTSGCAIYRYSGQRKWCRITSPTCPRTQAEQAGVSPRSCVVLAALTGAAPL
jgi:hypothetical protein